MTQKRDEVIYRRDWPLIVAVVLQLTAFVWFGGKLDNRVEQLEKWVLTNGTTAERLAALETSLKELRQQLHGDLHDIKALLMEQK